MAALRTFAGGGGTFAHLLGRSKAASAKAKAEDDVEETEEEKRERERKEREDAKASSENDDDTDGKSKKAKSKADREDDDIEEADDLRENEEDDDEHDPDEVDERNRAGKKSRRAKVADDKDEDTRAAGRKAERARGSAIFASPAAALRPDMAAHLAFHTNLSTRAAVDTLAAMAAGAPQSARRAGVAERMAGTPNPDVGQEDQRPAQRKASLGERIASLQKKIGAA